MIERDVWATAKLMIDRHGEDATIFAAMKADRMLSKGDIEGQKAWLRIWRAIEDLQRAPPKGTRLT